MTLSDYVLKRNGVPLGASDSLKNMLLRSLGAGSFSGFWTHWNPIWSYFLGIYIFKPARKIFSRSWSLIITFAICGLLHDLAVILIKQNFQLLITQWFLLMGVCVVLSKSIRLNYSSQHLFVRALVNTSIILSCLALAYQVRL